MKYNLPFKHLSVSQINTWYGCGQDYKYTYLEGKRGERGRALILGSTLDAALGTVCASKYVGAPIPDFDTVLAQYDLTVEPVNRLVLDEILMLKRFLKAFTESEFFAECKILALQKPTMADFGEGIRVKGYIDLICEYKGEVYIMDFKCVSQHYSPKKTDGDEQLTIYSYGEDIPNVGHITFSKKNTTRSFMKINLSKRDKSHYDSVREWAKRAAFGITLGDFEFPSGFYWKCRKGVCNHFEYCTNPKVVRDRDSESLLDDLENFLNVQESLLGNGSSS